MVEIIPAILTNDPVELIEMLKRCEGAVGRVQIDIVDGQFVDNKTIDPSSLEQLDLDLNLDFHLMVKEPIGWVEKCGRAGADRIIAQVEEMGDQVRFLEKVEEVGASVGLALDLGTEIGAIDASLLTSLDVILLMAVKAGWGGQKFGKSVLKKIEELGNLRKKENGFFKICVDGGETVDVIDDTYAVGADEVAIGRKLFEGNLAENITRFQKAAEK